MKTANPPAKGISGFLAKLGIGRRAWETSNVKPVQQITPVDTYLYGAGQTSVATLLGNERKPARCRQEIYEKWSAMESDPIISSAVQLLVTAALGGHETNGELVFVEARSFAKEDKRYDPIIQSVEGLQPLFNKVATQMAFIGAIYGDAYARIFTDPQYGVTDIFWDELFRPQLVQPYERAGRTVGFVLSTGERNFERMSIKQLARLRMPRTQWVPQFGPIERALKYEVTEDDPDKLPILPSLVGGSLIYPAEDAYDNLWASLTGLVGQRWIDSIDEQIITVNVDNMDKDKKEQILRSYESMLRRSKGYAEDAVKRGRPVLERIRHLIPVFGDKQVATFSPISGGQATRAGDLSIDDIMLHARLLSGALGVDLSMIGFGDQMSGGLGEGGFFRMSAQAAERARVIRVALVDFFNSIIDIHTLTRFGIVFRPDERPWEINFYGSISALEADKQRTQMDGMSAGVGLVQAMRELKDMGADKKMMKEFLQKTMRLDEDQADLYSNIVDMNPPQAEEDAGGF